MRALPDYQRAITPMITSSLEIDNTNEFMTMDRVNQELNNFIASTDFSELLRLIVVFEKVPKNMTFGVNVKVGQGYFTKISLTDNCSISVDRSNSGETLGNSSYFTNLKPAQTDFDCKLETDVKIELILDDISVEAFFFDWYSFTTLVFSDKANKGVNIWASLDQNYIRVKYLKADVLKKTMGVSGDKGTQKR